MSYTLLYSVQKRLKVSYVTAFRLLELARRTVTRGASRESVELHHRAFRELPELVRVELATAPELRAAGSALLDAEEADGLAELHLRTRRGTVPGCGGAALERALSLGRVC